MKNQLKNLFIAVILFISGAAVAAVEQGKDYKLIPPQQTSTKKIEVLEFFSYACIHCFHFHPHLSAWERKIPKDVELVYVPVPNFNPSWGPMALAYYALESMGQSHQMHDVLYKAWHVDNEVLNDEAKILDYLAPRGVDRAKFSAAYNDFSKMSKKITRAQQMTLQYQISGTPTLIVDGKYAIQATTENGLQPADMIRVLNEVIAIARKEHADAAAESKQPVKAK